MMCRRAPQRRRWTRGLMLTERGRFEDRDRLHWRMRRILLSGSRGHVRRRLCEQPDHVRSAAGRLRSFVSKHSEAPAPDGNAQAPGALQPRHMPGNKRPHQ